MDFEIVWSPAAVEDVESLADYIARDSEFYARAVVDRIIDTANKLKVFPASGRIVPECADETIRDASSTATDSSTGWRALESRFWQSFTANGLLIS